MVDTWHHFICSNCLRDTDAPRKQCLGCGAEMVKRGNIATQDQMKASKLNFDSYRENYVSQTSKGERL